MSKALLRLPACLLLVSAGLQGLSAQQPTLAELDLAVAAWLGDDWTVEQHRQEVVGRVLATDQGLRYLSEQLRAVGEAPSRRRTGLRKLATHVVLGFIDRARGSGMVFRGQYDDLKSMQPFAGEVLLDLLLRPPDWFASTRRAHLVPAIADLQPRLAAAAVVEAIADIIEDTETEPADLRLGLSCLAWQWGHRQYVHAELARLRATSSEGDAEDRLLAFRAIADLHYRVREYDKAASTHRALQMMADRAELELTPTDWYWSACYHALAGKVARGFESLERCVSLLASPGVDSSLKLPQSLFEQDPDIARLRADPRFAAIVARAFPVPKTGRGQSGRGGRGDRLR